LIAPASRFRPVRELLSITVSAIKGASMIRVTSALLALLLLAAPVAAQSRINADRLPLDLNRVKRQLAASTDRVERDGLNLRYHISIYAPSPRIELFAPDENLTTGPVPYGAPTHRDFIEFWTPQEFRSPAADLSAVFRWLADRQSGRKTESKMAR
jgi:hypothetical protein